MGFCLFGNVALAAHYARRKHGVGRVLIVDTTLLGRFYERYGDHAVSVAKRTVFVVTGRMPGYGGDENL